MRHSSSAITRTAAGKRPPPSVAQRKGFAPLAARPGAQSTGLMQFAPMPVFPKPLTQTVCSRKRLHPQIPFCFLFLAKQKARQSGLFVWRRERDLNPWIHSCITRFRIVRVRPLRHLCKFLSILHENPEKCNRFCVPFRKISAKCRHCAACRPLGQIFLPYLQLFFRLVLIFP